MIIKVGSECYYLHFVTDEEWSQRHCEKEKAYLEILSKPEYGRII